MGKGEERDTHPVHAACENRGRGISGMCVHRSILTEPRV